MTAYFLRRLMLIPITFVVISFLVYAVQRLTPGGPIEQARLRMLGAAGESGGSATTTTTGTGELKLPEEALKQLQRYYKLDKPIPVGYLIWLGLWPDEDKGGAFSGILQGDFGKSYRYGEPVLKTITDRFPVSIYFGLIGYLMSWIVCVPLGVKKALRHRSPFDTGTSILVFLGYSIPGFVVCLVMLLVYSTDMGGALFGSAWWRPAMWASVAAVAAVWAWRAVLRRRDALTPRAENWLGIGSVVLAVLAAIMLSSLLHPLPLGGFRSEGWAERWARGDVWWCIGDQLRHTAIPLVGYMLGSFATMTILMKNSLLENLGADYVRTAFAKGLPEGRVVFIHALRNSLIPLMVGIGHALGILFAGSFLIERTCNINGFGLLGYESLLQRDYPVLMGELVFLELIGLFGNLLSDVILALTDPRVRFK